MTNEIAARHSAVFHVTRDLLGHEPGIDFQRVWRLRRPSWKPKGALLGLFWGTTDTQRCPAR